MGERTYHYVKPVGIPVSGFGWKIKPGSVTWDACERLIINLFDAKGDLIDSIPMAVYYDEYGVLTDYFTGRKFYHDGKKHSKLSDMNSVDEAITSGDWYNPDLLKEYKRNMTTMKFLAYNKSLSNLMKSLDNIKHGKKPVTFVEPKHKKKENGFSRLLGRNRRRY